MSNEAVLILNNNQYKLSGIINLTSSAQAITVQEHELKLDFKFEVHNGSLDDNPIVLFYKYEGKYVVLAGLNKVIDGARSGRLVSSVMLKKAKIEQLYDAQSIYPSFARRTY
jgi:hypothetical protein